MHYNPQMIENGQKFFTPKQERRLHRLEQHFVDNSQVGQIDIYAIAHDWEPSEIVDDAVSYDVVTLELTRGAVQAGLSGEDTSISKRNIFWRQVVEGLRPAQEGKLIRGITVNQTPRVSYKRFMSSLNPEYAFGRHATVEVADPTAPILEKFLSDADIAKLLKYNWINTDDQNASLTVFTKFIKSMEMMKKGKISKRNILDNHKVPLSFPNNIEFLLSLQPEKREDDKPFIITFFKAPDRSLFEAQNALTQMFADLPLDLTTAEKGSLGRSAITNSLVAHAERTEAWELVNALCQYVESSQPTPNTNALHIGGAIHSQSIKHVIDKHIGNQDVLKVNIKDDPRFDRPILSGSLNLLMDITPFQDRLAGTRIEGYEAYANSDFVQTTKDIMEANIDKLTRHVAIDRAWAILAYGMDEKPESFKLRARLSELTIEQLKRFAEIENEEERDTTVQALLQ